MNNHNYDESNLCSVQKAKDYHSYYVITKQYPEVKKLTEKEIFTEICKSFENSINAKKNDCGELYYQYVIYGLMPMYEQVGDKEILDKCLQYLKTAESTVYECNLLRDIYVVKAKIFLLLQLFSHAEKYILLAYNDFDYRTSTFFLLMKILDSQNKFELMIYYLKQYCIDFFNLHEKIKTNDFDVLNIKTSDYIDKFNAILEGDYVIEC